jgi:peptide/nickel transport system substrate-binding protein
MVAATLVAVLILSALVGALTLGARTTSAAGSHPFRSLRIGTQAWTVTTLNPNAMTLVDEYIVVYSVYSTLLTRDKGYHITGDLAYSWSVAPDNVTWTFNLVHGAYFIDPANPSDRSHPVTATDVVFSYNLEINNESSILNTYTADIVNITALDTYTVQIVTDVPVATMSATAANIPIFPEYVWSSISDPVGTSPPNPIGSGGFYYDYQNSTASLAVLRKNPAYYWDQYYCSVVRPDEIRFISYTNPTQMVSDFQSGANQLNTIIGVDPTTYTTTLKDWNPKWAVDQGFVGEIAINAMTNAMRSTLNQTQFGSGTNNQILATNWTVRWAIAMSINKTALLQDALLGLGAVGDTLVPDTNPWHYAIPDQYQYHFDTAAARRMLNDAGWKYDASGNLNPGATPLYQAGGTNPLKFRFYTLNTEDWWKAAAQDIVTWLGEAGIQTTDLHGTPGYGAYSINQMSGYWLAADYDFWLWDWVFTPASDPSADILEVETTDAIGPTSDNFYSNPTFDALYNQSLVTIDPVARRAILNQMQLIMYNDTYYIIPFYKADLYAAAAAPPGTGQTWLNWGDWGKHNGLTPDSDLMNLWTQVDPQDNPAPVIVNFPQVQWVSGSSATIGVSVFNPQATSLTYSFDFGDGTYLNDTTTVPVTHTYASPGTYPIQVRVSNSEFPACSSTTAKIVAPGSFNQPPHVLRFAPSALTANPGQSIQFTLNASDTEGDPLYVTWNFGDSSSPTTSYMASGTQAGATVSTSHTYSALGVYAATATVSDNQTDPNFNHAPSVTATVEFVNPYSQPGGPPVQTNPLIEFGIPILIVAVIVVVAAVILLRRRARMKKEEQEVQEEPKPGPPNPPP